MRLEEAYRILGLNPGCDEQEVKKAYRTKAKYYHPDLNKSVDAEEKFKEIYNAYETIMKHLENPYGSYSTNSNYYERDYAYDNDEDWNYYYDYPEEQTIEISYEDKKIFLNYLKDQNCLITWVNQMYWTCMIPKPFSQDLITQLVEKFYNQLIQFPNLPESLQGMSLDYFSSSYGLFLWEFMLGIYDSHSDELDKRRIIDYRYFYPEQSRLYNYEYCPEFVKPKEFVRWIYHSLYLVSWLNDCLTLIGFPDQNASFKQNLYLDLTLKAYKEFIRYHPQTNSIIYFRGGLHSIIYAWALKIYNQGYRHVTQQMIGQIFNIAAMRNFMSDYDEDYPIQNNQEDFLNNSKRNKSSFWAAVIFTIVVVVIGVIAIVIRFAFIN